MNTGDLTALLLAAFALVCVVPLIVVAVIAALVFTVGRRALSEFLNPDVGELRRRFQRLRAAHPSASNEELIGRLIRGQAVRSGVVGAVTGLGGFITLPVALPLDVLLSLRLQAAIVDFIAEMYGRGDSDAERRVRTALILSGSGRLGETVFSVIMRFLLRVVGKSFSKLIPFIGAAVSFGLNFAIAQAVGSLALRVYRARAG